MSDNKSRSPPQPNVLANREGYHSSPTSRPVAPDGTSTTSRNRIPATSNPMLLSVAGVPVIGPQSPFAVAQSAHRSTTLPSETLVSVTRVGMPTLVASGLVSLPPSSATGLQQPKILTPDQSTSSAQESLGTPDIRVHSPNLPHVMDDRVSPVSQAGSQYHLQQSAREAVTHGSCPRTVQRTLHRVLTNHKAHSSISLEASGDRILSLSDVSSGSRHVIAQSDIQRTIPVVAVQRASSLTTSTLTLPILQTVSLNDKQNVALKCRGSPLQQQTSPLPKRISPLPRRILPIPRTASPLQQQLSQSQQRVSPVPQRVSSIQHRDSPVDLMSSKHKVLSGSDRQNASPIPGSKAPQVMLTVSSVTAQGQPNSSTCLTTCTSARKIQSTPVLYRQGQQPENKLSELVNVTNSNPFIAAINASKSVTGQATNEVVPSSSTNGQLQSFIIINKPEPSIKVENMDDAPVPASEVMLKIPESGDFSGVDPICKSSCSMQSLFSDPHVVLSQQMTSLVTTSSSCSRRTNIPSNLASKMPLLSNIMGLIPKSDHYVEDKKFAVNIMPKLFPERSGTNILVKSETVQPRDVIKTEDEEREDSKLTPMTNPFCLRLKNLNNFPSCHTNAYRPTYRSQGMAIHRAKTGCIMNAARSLDLLRSNLQKFINKEIDAVIQNYINVYFRPGIENIRENNGHMAVSDDHVQAVCQQILEEAKKMYMTGSRCNTPDPNDNVSETGSLVPPENRDVREKKLDLFRIKKRHGSSDSEASLSKKPKRKGRPPLKFGNGRSITKQGKHEPVKKEGPKWDPDRILPETQFVMGARANKALGLGAQRGRLYIKHPDLFKYAGDQEDKNWLHENHHMPATGGKAYLLVVDDILSLAETDEYKDSPGLMLDEIVGFTVPDWMREKMKTQMKALRTDLPKSVKNKPSAQQQPVVEDSQVCVSSKTFSTPDKSDTQPSPSTTENMDVASTDQDVDDLPSVSPLNVTGVFTTVDHSSDVSPPPSVGYEEADDDNDGDDDDEPPLTAPFELGEALN